MQFLEFLDRYGKQMTTLLMFVTTLINTPLEVSGLNEKKWPKSITTSPNMGFVLRQ